MPMAIKAKKYLFSSQLVKHKMKEPATPNKP
jgi:hypothetical protein